MNSKSCRVKSFKLHFIGLLLCCWYCGNLAAKEILLSSSEGVFVLGTTKPLYQKLTKEGDSLAAFKTVFISDTEVLTAWGSGRQPVRSKLGPIASLERINLKDLSQRTTLFSTPGKRIRDFVLDGGNVVAVGHNEGDVHIYSLTTGKHKVLHLNTFEGAICHAIEMADVDGDGVKEFYITVTSPNSSGGLGQQGQLVRLDVDWNNFTMKVRVVFDAYEHFGSYVKEIAVVDLNADGKTELLAEVSPQIEVYGRNELEYAEPMRLVLLKHHDAQYQQIVLAAANIRLGRNISYEDIDQDGRKEVFFIDYYQSGIYVMEDESEHKKALGDNVNSLGTDWRLTRVNIYSADNKIKMDQAQLSGNQIIYIDNPGVGVLGQQNLNNVLVSTSDSFMREVQGDKGKLFLSMPMTVRLFQIKSQNAGFYSLTSVKSAPVAAKGDLWHISEATKNDSTMN